MRRILIATSNAGQAARLCRCGFAARSRNRRHPRLLFPARGGRGWTHLRGQRAQEGRSLLAAMFPERLWSPTIPAWRSTHCTALRACTLRATPRPSLQNKEPHEADANTDDAANNARVSARTERRSADCSEQDDLSACWRPRETARRWRRFAARPRESFSTLRAGSNGFGYDPLFYFPQIQKTFAELSAEEKSKYSHRGAAFQSASGLVRANPNDRDHRRQEEGISFSR